MNGPASSRAHDHHVIDLHLHTTASDGLLPPAALVGRAASAGLTIISITDHDTVAGLREASATAVPLGVRVVAGIEATAVEQGRDVHILGYFLEPDATALASFLGAQRADRVRRVREMAGRLEAMGCNVDVDAVLATASGTRSLGRPALADALVAAGHAVDRQDAFARWLGAGRPAFVPRRGVSGAEAIDIIHRAGGIAALAHPVLLADDEMIPRLAADGLDALEVWHADHDEQARQHYAAIARRLDLAMSGGSDFHGDGGHHAVALGLVTLPPDEFAHLESRRASPSSSA